MLKENDEFKEKIMSILARTMDNWQCLDQEEVNIIVDDFLEKLIFEDGVFYHDGRRIRDISMVVANIKRRINNEL